MITSFTEKREFCILAGEEMSPTDEPPDSWESRNWCGIDPYKDTESPATTSSIDYSFKRPDVPPSRYERSDSDDSEQEEDSDDVDR